MRAGTVLVAHPSADLYGSDLQLVESVRGLAAAGWQVVVSLPHAGPLEPKLREAGATTEILDAPVLRKAFLRPAGLLRLFAHAARSLPGMVRQLNRHRVDVVYVNTVTLPLWLVAARLARTPALCHVHEAEDDLSRPIALLLNSPLLLARQIVVNSRAARETLLRAVTPLAARTDVVHNGVEGPPHAVSYGTPAPSTQRIVLVGRLAPRKGTDVAVEAIVLLRERGRDVELELCGSVFPGYEWFEDQLRGRVAAAGLEDRITFSGYTSPTWPALERAAVVLVPSRAEPFGNAAVEGQLACRPVIASAVQGLREIITTGETGLLVPPDDPRALADAIESMLDDPSLAQAVARAGRASALLRFAPARYQGDVVEIVSRTARR
jgi:glycosyltransferase involved in cell wall biosynthesis